LSWSEYIAVPEFLFSIFSSDDISFFYPARRELHLFGGIGGISRFVRSGIPDSEIFSFGAEDVEFIEIYGTIYGQYLLIADIGVFEHAERKSSDGIRRYGGDVHERCQEKPACLDEYSRYQCHLDDAKRRFFVFEGSFSAVRENAFDDGKEHHESQREVGEVLHHIPKFPQRCVEMEYRSVDERVVQCESCHDQKRSKKEVDYFEHHIKDLPKAHRAQ